MLFCRFTARYGVITTGRTWYFCKVDNGALHISPPIAWDSTNPPLLAAVSYIMTKAWEAKDNTISDFPTGQGGSHASQCIVEVHVPHFRVTA